MLDVAKIKELLADRNVQKVAKATGLNPHTIYRLVNETGEPLYSTVKALSDYFEGESSSCK